MSRILLIHAGPTPWDLEDRLVGNHPLPLSELARSAIEGAVQSITHAVSAIYRPKKNEACEQAAKLAAALLKLPTNDSKALDEVNLGLWQGLTRAELRFRFPSAFPQWEANPLAVNPPEGEPLNDAIARLRGGVKRILKKQRGMPVMFLLRPMAMQVVSGLLKGEDSAAIAGHLHNTAAIETIDVADDVLQPFIS